MNIEKIKEKLVNKISPFAFSDYAKTAVLLLLTEIKGELHIILEKRAKNIRQGGEISFPGGMFDEYFDKTFTDTALRETFEEIGIKQENIEILSELPVFLAPFGAIVNPYVGLTKDKSFKLNSNEVEKLIIVPLSFFINNEPEVYNTIIKVHPSYVDSSNGKEIVLFPAKDLDLPKQYHQPWGNVKNKIYLYKFEDETIWGLTAKIIFDFIQTIKD